MAAATFFTRGLDKKERKLVRDDQRRKTGAGNAGVVMVNDERADENLQFLQMHAC